MPEPEAVRRAGSDPMQRAIHEAIALVDHDPAWAGAFEAERARLLARFPGQLLAVEHIGSTAVAGMRAKPILDLIAGVASMAVADDLFEPVQQAGYTTSRAFNEHLVDRRWFMRAVGGARSHHLHVVELDGPVWRSHLLFRDRLRASPELAAAYARLKADLAVRHRHDREAYTDGKSAFVAAAIAPHAAP